MRFTLIVAVLCAGVWVTAGDVVHLKTAKARLAGKLLGKGRHHKRGALASIPTFKLGHDIPHVTHSIIKPLVVSYPPTATVSAVKVPLAHSVHRHKVHGSHSHYAYKFPYHSNTLLVPKPDHHFHHHHHHVPPKPVVPVVPANPVLPLAQPSATIDHPVPAPPPSFVFHQAPAAASLVPSQPLPIASPPLHVLPPVAKPVLQAAPVPIQPAPIVPAIPYAHQYPYVIRPGNAVQTSFFATYPRYPLVNYQSPLIPYAAPVAPAPVLFNRPHVPHFHLFQQEAAAHNGVVVEQHAHPLPVDQTPALLHPNHAAGPHPGLHVQNIIPQHEIHLHGSVAQSGVHVQGFPAQHEVHVHGAAGPQPEVHVQAAQPSAPLDHEGWNPVLSQPHNLQPHQLAAAPEPHHQFTQEPGTQVFEQHSGATDEQQLHELQHQIHQHIQQQLEQAQYEHNLHHQHQLSPEYGTPQDYHQQHVDQQYAHNGQEYAHHGQEYAHHGQEYIQNGQDYAQHAQGYAQHGQEFAQHGQEYPHPSNEYGLPQQQQQLGQEYGLPQQALEGRAADGEPDTQLYHNHIPLGLQPPIDRPLEHFQ